MEFGHLPWVNANFDADTTTIVMKEILFILSIILMVIHKMKLSYVWWFEGGIPDFSIDS